MMTAIATKYIPQEFFVKLAEGYSRRLAKGGGILRRDCLLNPCDYHEHSDEDEGNGVLAACKKVWWEMR